MPSIDYVRQTLRLEVLPDEQRKREIARFSGRIRVFHYRTNAEELAPHGGGLSLKMVLVGEESFTMAGRRIRVTPGDALLIPAGLEYGSVISKPTESFSVFFPRSLCLELAAGALGDALHPLHEVALDRLPPVPIAADGRLRRELGLARACLAAGDWSRAEELLQESAQQLVLTADELRTASARLSLQRPAQRQELVRRLQRARAYLHDHFPDPVSLAHLSEVCQVSRFHLLRSFREAFGCTPAQYQTELRLQRAQKMLDTLQRTSVAVVAQEVGYRSHSAFARAWRRRFATSPQGWPRAF